MYFLSIGAHIYKFLYDPDGTQHVCVCVCVCTHTYIYIYIYIWYVPSGGKELFILSGSECAQ